jgi:transcription elongation factor GreA
VGSNRISVTSPIGKALIGKKVGDLVKVQTPRGVRELEITDISVENDAKE